MPTSAAMSFSDVPSYPAWAKQSRAASTIWSRVDLSSSSVDVEAAVMANAVRLRAEDYPDQTYRAWPGPNSNTFVERILRDVDGLGAQLVGAFGMGKGDLTEIANLKSDLTELEEFWVSELAWEMIDANTGEDGAPVNSEEEDAANDVLELVGIK